MAMQRSWIFAALAAAGALALGGCSKEIDSAARVPAGPGSTGSASAAGPAAEGSADLTTRSSVGNR